MLNILSLRNLRKICFGKQKNLQMKSNITALFICFLSINQLQALNPSREYKVNPAKFGMVYKEEKIKDKR